MVDERGRNLGRFNPLASVDQDQFAVLLSLDLDLLLTGNRNSVARPSLDTIDPNPAARHEIEVPAWLRVDRDRSASIHRRSKDLRIGIDRQRAVIRIAA